MNPLNAWESRLLARAFFQGAVIVLFGLVITAVTDEGGLSWAVRVGRTVPVVPVCAALGVWLSLLTGRARGETRALATVGASPWRIASVAALGGVMVSLVAAMPVGVNGTVDLAGFYPTAVTVREFRDENGLFIDQESGAGVTAYGEIVAAATSRREPKAGPPPSRSRSHAAALSIVFGGVALSLLAARRGVGDGTSVVADVGAVSVYLVASILTFHAVAAEMSHAMAAALPSALFLAWNAFSFRRATWVFREPTSV